MKKWSVLKAIKIVFFIAIAILVFGFAVMSLWNWLVPTLFSGPVIGWWQAIGLLVLSKILFGGMHGGPRRHWGGRHARGYWRQRMEEKMANMTPEERERFRKQCGGWAWKREEPASGPGTSATL